MGARWGKYRVCRLTDEGLYAVVCDRLEPALFWAGFLRRHHGERTWIEKDWQPAHRDGLIAAGPKGEPF